MKDFNYYLEQAQNKKDIKSELKAIQKKIGKDNMFLKMDNGVLIIEFPTEIDKNASKQIEKLISESDYSSWVPPWGTEWQPFLSSKANSDWKGTVYRLINSSDKRIPFERKRG